MNSLGTDTFQRDIDTLFEIIETHGTTNDNSKTRGQQVVPPLAYRKQKQRIILCEPALNAYLSVLNRSTKDLLSYLVNKTGTQGVVLPDLGIALRGNIAVQSLIRLEYEFIKLVECEICNSIETTLIKGVKRCLACS